MSIPEFIELAMSFEGTEEHAHFDRRAFKVKGKRIFATLDERSGSVNVKLTKADQATYCAYDKAAVFPIPNKWGQQGWTTFQISKIPESLMLDVISTAYNDVVARKGR